MTIPYGIYEFLAALLIAIYLISALYLSAFRAGYAKKWPKLSNKIIPKGVDVSVIVPIYNENTEMIKGALDTLLNQKGIKVNLVVVIKNARLGQIKMIKSYAKVLNKVEVVVQRGKPSHDEAFLIGLRRIKTKYTCILCSDAKIKGNYLVKMISGLEKTGKDAAFGLLYPEIKDTKAGRFTAIGKIFKQDLTLKGRAALGLGCYVPGAFAVYKTEFLKAELKPLMKNNFVMHDVGLTMKLYTNTGGGPYFIPEVVGTELEKSTFSGWLLQHMRWFMGSLGLISVESEVFFNAKKA